MNKDNTYDMSMTCQLNGKFYERLDKSKYRALETLAGNYSIVTDKKLINKLDLIFKDVKSE